MLPSIESFHPKEINTDGVQCIARRTNKELRDLRFRPYVYRAIQCRNTAMIYANGLCENCFETAQAYSDGLPHGIKWYGLVTMPFTYMPATSHIAGSPWYHNQILEGTLFFNEEQVKTTSQGGLSVPEAEIRRFALGRCDLNIELLYQSRQLWKKDLCFILKMLGMDVDIDKFNGDKLCRMIRLALKVDDTDTTETG
jgi:hypothetical protein